MPGFDMSGVYGDSPLWIKGADDGQLFQQHAYGQIAEQQLGEEFGPDSGKDRENFPDAASWDAYEHGRLQHRTVLANLAYRGRAAQDEILRRHDSGSLSPDYAHQVDLIKQQRQEEQDRHIVQGLSSGQYVIASQEDQQRLANNANARAKFRNSPYLTDDQKDELIKQTFANDAEIRRAATPIPPEQIPQQPQVKLQKQLAQMPPDVRQKLAGVTVLSEKGVPQVMRGVPKDVFTPQSQRGQPSQDGAPQPNGQQQQSGGPFDQIPGLAPRLYAGQVLGTVTQVPDPSGKAIFQTSGGAKVEWVADPRHPDGGQFKPYSPQQQMLDEFHRNVVTMPDGREFQRVQSKTGVTFKELRKEKAPGIDKANDLTLDQRLIREEHYNAARDKRRKEIAKELDDEKPQVPNDSSWGIPGISSATRDMNAADKYKEVEKRLGSEMGNSFDEWLKTHNRPGQGPIGENGKQQGNVPVVDTDEDYAKLPPGAEFVDKSGKRYRKPGR